MVQAWPEIDWVARPKSAAIRGKREDEGGGNVGLRLI